MRWCLRMYLKRCVESRHFSNESVSYERKVSSNIEEQLSMLHQHPIMPRHPRLLRVAIIGSPNAGKSTLANQLMNWRVCSVSNKVHTTRKNTKAVYVQDDVQLVLLDTPGLVTNKHAKRHYLEDRLVGDPFKGAMEADVIAVVHDISNKPHRYVLDRKIVRLLSQYTDRTHILLLNKIDRLKDKKKLLRITQHLCNSVVDGVPIPELQNKNSPHEGYDALLSWRENVIKGEKVNEKSVEKYMERYEGWSGFKTVFMISSLSGEGVKDVKDYFLESAIPAAWLYHPSVVTDQRPDEIALMAVKEKLLYEMPQEVPHKLKVEIEYWNVDDLGCLDIIFRITYSQKNLGGLLVGPRGKTIHNISKEVEQNLRNTFRCEVRVKLGIYHVAKLLTDTGLKFGNWK